MKPKCKARRRALITYRYGRIRRSHHGRGATVARPEGSEPSDCAIMSGLSTSIDGLMADASGGHTEMPSNPFWLLGSRTHREVTGIHPSGVGGHSPCRAYWSDADGFGGLADPIVTPSGSCPGDSATAGGVQPTFRGYSPNCSPCPKHPDWADFAIDGGRSVAKKGAERWRAPSLWPCPWVGFSAGTSVPVSPRAGLAEKTSDPTHSPLSLLRQRQMSR
jgi:hypothetical protein